MNAVTSKCPICKIPLSIKNLDKYDIEYCSSCKREFYPIKIEQDAEEKLEYDDIETSSQYGGEPILLCDEKDNKGFPRKKNQSYLADYFDSSVTIETREFIPE
jgi:uncharacterized Zn finger protein (UPF0148 family)